MDGKYVELPGSFRLAPNGSQPLRAASGSDLAQISVYLKDRDGDPLDQPMTAGAREPRSTIAIDRAQTYADAITCVSDFARRNGLSVVRCDPARRLVKLAGSLARIEGAFRTRLVEYHDGQRSFRSREGSLSVPHDVAEVVEAVLGLDTRPLARPNLQLHFNPHTVAGHLPHQMAALYGFPPTPTTGQGQCIALIELGGGYRDTDTAAAFAAMGLPVPKVIPISVSGGINQPGLDSKADTEVALDIQVAGAAAPGATIAVYFAPNTTQGFVDAVSRAAADPLHRPSVLAISWGAPEASPVWPGQAMTAMTSALRDAARAGITVLVASGDNLATDGVKDGRVHVDFPASSPYALACGGTMIDTGSVGILSETVWNRDGQGTGGGVSEVYPVPPYQANVALPPSVSTGRAGRGVPDLAASADPASGYRIVIGGVGGTIGGTSAVAPLLAGLFARINAARGGTVGLPHGALYGQRDAFRPVVKGNNMDGGGLGYAAGPGWNACTGLGAPIGARLLDMFVKHNDTKTV